MRVTVCSGRGLIALWRWLLAAMLALTWAAPAAGAEWAILSVEGHEILAEVADTAERRTVGLMYRKSLSENHGMLFVYPESEHQSMWMANTGIALSVAFIDVNGTIINIADMTPYSHDTHSSTVPARFALEVNRGWFAARGVGPGARLKGLERFAGGKSPLRLTR